MAITPEQLAKSGTEHGEQSALFCWRQQNEHLYPQLKWLYAVPNGFFSDGGQKAKMKAEGLRDGVPDCFLPVPIHDYMDWTKAIKYCGLYIEMKREKYRNVKDGGLSEDQKEWIAYLALAGYKVVVCYNWQEARDMIIKYLEGK